MATLLLAILLCSMLGAVQMSVAVRNARADAVETQIGATAVMKFFSGSLPANCAAADANGTPLAVLTLPADWMNAASSGSKTLLGLWTDTAADNTGTASHFRIYASDGTTCGMQGTVTATGGGGDVTLESTSITAGQAVTMTSFTITEPNS